jgi:DNA-binding HxlR family transcriptional regulator
MNASSMGIGLPPGRCGERACRANDTPLRLAFRARSPQEWVYFLNLYMLGFDCQPSYAGDMHPDRFRYTSSNCSIARTLGVVGEKWTLLVLREAFYGVRRFDDFHAALGCARNLLSARLKTLAGHGILEKKEYQDDRGRRRHEYRLTDKGRDLFPAVVALMQWGDRWAADEAGPAVLLSHRDCGERVSVRLSCDAGHGPLSAREVSAAPGPGAHEAA